MPDIFFSNEPPAQVIWQTGEAGGVNLLLGLTKDKKLCRVSFLEKRKPSALIKEWKKEWPETKFEEASRKTAIKPTTPILLVGSDFQHRVWSALLDIPEGETLTYGEMAARIGKPGASRAVGTALGANPVAYYVPCHRVVAAGGIGGFSSDLGIKRALLNQEALTAFRTY